MAERRLRAPAFIAFLLGVAAAGVAFLAWLSTSAEPPQTTYLYRPVDAVEIRLKQKRSPVQVFRHSLPGDLKLFLDGFDKSGLASFADLPRAAEGYRARWEPVLRAQGFSEMQARAVSLMLFTSTLWGYGNAEHPDRPGCLTINEDNGWKAEVPTIDVVRRARIGCCTDYAYMLSLLLAANGFENRYVNTSDHIFNEARIDGEWHVLDANANVFITTSWAEAGLTPETEVHLFPHPGTQRGKLHRPMMVAFQDYMTNMVVFGKKEEGTVRPGRSPGTSFASLDRLHFD